MPYKAAGSGYGGGTLSYARKFTFLPQAAHLNLVVRKSVLEEAQKLVERHQKYVSNLASSLRRKEKRSGVLPLKVIKLPAYWSAHSGFNPYHVRAHADSIAYAIDKALDAKAYRPRPAVEYEVPKKDGGMRKVSVFPVADNAVSRLTFQRLMDKNARHLSANAYAYRNDLGIHDAILHISSDFSGRAGSSSRNLISVSILILSLTST
jgi:RNA-directed DNA polymerase